jgi:hypothetical protein
MDISPRRPTALSLRSALAALLVVAATLVAAPAFLIPAEGAVQPRAAGARAHARAHLTTKSATFVSDIGNVQAALNRCRGPVAWNSRGEGAPWLMFEHDYCGGAWVLSTRAGDRLQIRNGALVGTWRANGRTRMVSRGALVSTTRGLGHLVVQTCVPGSSRMRLVGFDQIG